MDPWTVLAGLIVVMLLFVAIPIGLDTFMYWRRPRRLTCPLTRAEAQINVAPTGAAIAGVIGSRIGLERCSLWSKVQNCREECLLLPAAALRAVPRGTPPPRPERAPGAFTILVPLDGSAGSERALDAIGELARERRATVCLVHVAKAPETVWAGDGGPIVAFTDQETARVNYEFQMYVKRLAARMPGVRVEGAVRFGGPLTQIVEEAESVGADVIAMATHRRSALRRVAKRSLAKRLGRATRTPLLLVSHGARAAA